MELMEEGLGDKVDKIQYPDLKVLEVIRLLDYKAAGKYSGIKYSTPQGLGIFVLCDDETKQVINGQKKEWQDTMDNIDREHKANTKIYTLDRKLRCAFSINHSAQIVKYDMKEFVERNVDVIATVLESAMCEKTDEGISCIY